MARYFTAVRSVTLVTRRPSVLVRSVWLADVEQHRPAGPAARRLPGTLNRQIPLDALRDRLPAILPDPGFGAGPVANELRSPRAHPGVTWRPAPPWHR
jgi:hypothetical protein